MKCTNKTRMTSLLKVVVASTNPVKKQAIESAFVSAFPGRTIVMKTTTATSGVRDQPQSDEETLCGARNRVFNTAKTMLKEADFIATVEGGIEEQPKGSGRFVGMAWVVVASCERFAEGFSAVRSSSFPLPTELSDASRKDGGELGPACDALFGVKNTKHDAGAIGLLTSNIIPRAELYRPTILMALIPFINQTLHFQLIKWQF